MNYADTICLPEKWCVKSTPETFNVISKFWDDTLNLCQVYSYPVAKGSYENSYFHSHNLVSGVSMFEKGAGSNYTSKFIEDGFTEISFDIFSKVFLKDRKTYYIKGSDMKKLYDTISNSCSWKERVFSLYGKEMLDDTPCVVKDYLYEEALAEANDKQKELLAEIFNPLDFSILNDRDIFFMEVKPSYKYLFKGKDPFKFEVRGFAVDSNMKFYNRICNKSQVVCLRKATKDEEELYYKHYPEFKHGEYIIVWNREGDFHLSKSTGNKINWRYEVYSKNIGYTYWNNAMSLAEFNGKYNG